MYFHVCASFCSFLSPPRNPSALHPEIVIHLSPMPSSLDRCLCTVVVCWSENIGGRCGRFEFRCQVGEGTSSSH